MVERNPDQIVHALPWVPPKTHGLFQAQAIAAPKNFLGKFSHVLFIGIFCILKTGKMEL